jgi:hypothetical protein
MVGSKVLRYFYSTCGESVQPKTNRLVVLMVKSDMDPRMIIKLEHGLKLVMVMLVICLWLMLLCGFVYTYTLVIR